MTAQLLQDRLPAIIAKLTVMDVMTAHGFSPMKTVRGVTYYSCPFHQPDEKPSFAASRDGKAWFCHSQCGVGGGLIKLEEMLSNVTSAEAIEKLASLIGQSRDGQSARRPVARTAKCAVATYDYQDERGVLRYQAIRYEPKDFRMRCPDGHGGWTYSLDGVERIPYRLPEVLGAVEQGVRVFVVEGEKDADRLARLGLVATTNAQGAGRWPPGWARYFQGASVMVLPDNDEAGHRHAAMVADSLKDVARDVRVVELPGLPPKGDVSDWLDAGRGSDELLLLCDAASAFVPGELASSSEKCEAEPQARKTSQATELVDMACSRYRFGRSEDDRLFAVSLDGPNIAIPLRRDKGLRQALASSYHRVHHKVPSNTALADAMNVLEGRAYECEREPVALRVAEHQGQLVLDLGDETGRCVMVGPKGWRIEERCPVLFRRSELTGALPTPVRGGDLDELRHLINVGDESWRLLVGILVAALFPNLAHVVVLFTGEQGSAKTTAARLVGGLVDPSPAPARSAPTDLDQWSVTAANSWVVLLDNLSTIPGWLSDALCRAATGDAYAKRTLYSDDDVTVRSYRRIVLLTAIDVEGVNGDLADRMVVIELDRILPETRLSESMLNARYAEARPRLLGALLDLTAKVLAALPDVAPERLPRMADFARVLAAMDKVNGWETVPAYERAGREAAAAVGETNPVAAAIATHVRQHGSVTVSASELLKTLRPETATGEWPKTAQGMGGAIKRLAPALRATGINVDKDRASDHHRKRAWTFSVAEGGPTTADCSTGEDTACLADDETQSAESDAERRTSRTSRTIEFDPFLDEENDADTAGSTAIQLTEPDGTYDPTYCSRPLSQCASCGRSTIRTGPEGQPWCLLCQADAGI